MNLPISVPSAHRAGPCFPFIWDRKNTLLFVTFAYPYPLFFKLFIILLIISEKKFNRGVFFYFFNRSFSGFPDFRGWISGIS